MTPGLLRNLKLLAMHAVVTEPGEYTTRHIFRWYSREFGTPLHVVESLPLEDVLQHYFECQYEELAEEQRAETIRRLLIDPDKLSRIKRQEDAEDADAWEFGKEAAAQAPADVPINAPPVDPITERFEAARKQVEDLSKKIDTAMESATLKEPLPENVHLTFEDLDSPEVDDAPSFGPNAKFDLG